MQTASQVTSLGREYLSQSLSPSIDCCIAKMSPRMMNCDRWSVKAQTNSCRPGVYGEIDTFFCPKQSLASKSCRMLMCTRCCIREISPHCTSKFDIPASLSHHFAGSSWTTTAVHCHAIIAIFESLDSLMNRRKHRLLLMKCDCHKSVISVRKQRDARQHEYVDVRKSRQNHNGMGAG